MFAAMSLSCRLGLSFQERGFDQLDSQPSGECWSRRWKIIMVLNVLCWCSVFQRWGRRKELFLHIPGLTWPPTRCISCQVAQTFISIKCLNCGYCQVVLGRGDTGEISEKIYDTKCAANHGKEALPLLAFSILHGNGTADRWD